MDPPTNLHTTKATENVVADQPEAGPSTVSQSSVTWPLDPGSVSIVSNTSASSADKKAKKNRLKREGAQVLHDAFNGGTTRPTAEQKRELLRRVNAIEGCGDYTIGSLEMWFNNRRRSAKLSKDTQRAVGAARRFPSLTAAALEILATLFAESPRPSSQVINVWATLLKATVEDVEAWVRAEQERLATLSITTQASPIDNVSNYVPSPVLNTQPFSLNANNEVPGRLTRHPSIHPPTPTSIAGPQFTDLQGILSPLLEQHLAGLPFPHASSSRGSSLEASSRRPSASLSPAISYNQNLPTSLQHLTQNTMASRFRSPALSELGLPSPSPSLSASTPLAGPTNQLYTPVTPVTLVSAELPFSLPKISSSSAALHNSPSPPPPSSLPNPPSLPLPPPSLPPPPPPPYPPPLTLRDRFLLHLGASILDPAISGTGVSPGEGMDEQPASQHPKSTAEFKAFFAPYQDMMEDLLGRCDSNRGFLDWEMGHSAC